MPAPAKCPGCGTKLQPDWENCPNCPMSFPDLEEPSNSPLRNSPHRDVIRPGLFLLALGLGFWWMLGALWRIGEESSKTVVVDKQGNERVIEGDTIKAVLDGQLANPGEAKTTLDKFHETAVGRASAPAAGDPGAAASGTGTASASDEGEGQGTISVVTSKAAPARRAREWKLRGTVFDLVTLQPIPGCTLVFQDVETNARIETRANAKGEYRTIVPPLEGRGYLVEIVKKGYAATHLQPGLQDPRELGEPERRAMAADLSASIAPPSTVQPVGEAPLVTDFYLPPAR